MNVRLNRFVGGWELGALWSCSSHDSLSWLPSFIMSLLSQVVTSFAPVVRQAGATATSSSSVIPTAPPGGGGDGGSGGGGGSSGNPTTLVNASLYRTFFTTFCHLLRVYNSMAASIHLPSHPRRSMLRLGSYSRPFLYYSSTSTANGRLGYTERYLRPTNASCP